MQRIVFLITVTALALHGKAQDVSLSLQKSKKLSARERSEKWSSMPANTVISFASTGVRYQQDIPPAIKAQNTWATSAWKNEKVHTQILISSKKEVKNITVVASDLKDMKGNLIKSDNISAGFVQYVLTDEFKRGCAPRQPKELDTSMVADIINTDLKDIDIQKNMTQPVWLTVNVPEHTVAGKYNGIVTVKADREYKLKIAMTVVNQTLPSPKDWTFRLDYWQHPAAVARVHDVELWSDAHFDRMRQYYTMLADAGQKIITASIVNEPWGHQTYDDYPGLVKWTKKRDGTWEYDYSLFDRYIDFVMSCGITEQINCYSMVPWKIAFTYYDEALQKDTVFTGKIGTPEYNAFWQTMLTDFTAHLKQKGWFDITMIAMDERPVDAMKAVIKLSKKVDPDWKISLAGNYHPEIEEDIDDYCIASRWTFPDSVLKKRKQQGKASTWYVCCTEKYPNMFTFSPPEEAVWAGWYTAATDMDGFLRWAHNSWPKDPFTDSRFGSWPAGDTYQVYPGPLSSIRFEKLIEGIQDFEKIKKLCGQYSEKKETKKLNTLKSALQTFTIKELSSQSAQQMVERYKNLLNE